MADLVPRPRPDLAAALAEWSRVTHYAEKIFESLDRLSEIEAGGVARAGRPCPVEPDPGGACPRHPDSRTGGSGRRGQPPRRPGGASNAATEDRPPITPTGPPDPIIVICFRVASHAAGLAQAAERLDDLGGAALVAEAERWTRDEIDRSIGLLHAAREALQTEIARLGTARRGRPWAR